mgnify:CR=1 FL=1
MDGNENIADMVMTVDEVSEYLRLAQSTVYKLVNEGKIPGVKIGGSWRISRRVLDEWLKARWKDLEPKSAGNQ